MADIPVRPRRRTTPSWLWIVVGIVALLIVLALIDFFVTNIVFTRGAGPGPAPAGDPFGGDVAPSLLPIIAVLSPLTRRF